MPTPKGTVPWNAGTSQGWRDKRGYRWRYVQEGGRRVARREHRVFMEDHIGRRLEPWEVVHHKDGNPANNELSNLEIKEFGTHTAEHHQGTRKSEQAKRRMEAFALMREELHRCRSLNADLLAALKMFTAWADDTHDTSPAAQHDAAMVSARAAIARATGA